jgi:glycosyltransferase involved in cell wall biosynthesis
VTREKRRILLAVAGLPAGGAERQLSLLARHLDRSRYDVGLLIFNAAERVHYREIFESPLWFKALGLSNRRPWSSAVGLLTGITGAVHEFKPDLIHSTLNVANHAIRTVACLNFWRVPIVTSIRVDFQRGYSAIEKTLEWLLRHRSATIVCNSEAVRRQMIQHLHVSPSRVATIFNGVDDTFFLNRDLTRPPGWPKAPVGLVVGRFVPQKNHLAFIEAVRVLRDRGALGSWHFVLVGEGPLLTEIGAAIEREALQERVTLAPVATSVLPLYGAASLVIIPSQFEGMPNVALEAQAAGCPVAISAAANDAEVVTVETGWILGSPLYTDLQAALEAAPATLAERGRLAQRRMQERFSVHKMVRETEATYEKVLKNR